MSETRPAVTEVEQHGIGTIPERDRTARPLDIFRLTFGTANSFPVVVIGAFPIFVFGLSFWEALAATFAGLVVGSAILMPMALFGPRTGTNNAVSSGAHFGVVGRIGGSFLALLTALTFFALAVYTSGDVLVGALDRIAGTGQPDWLLALAYAFFAVLILAIALYGFEFMLAINKIGVIAATVLFVLGFVALAGRFDSGYDGIAGTDALPLAPAFIGAVLLVAANPLSFGSFLGDWSRYVPEATSPKRLMGAAFLGQLATILPLGFGLFTSVAIVSVAPSFAEAGNYAGGLVAASPGWFLAPICVIALIGGLAAGSTCLYGPGLDFSSVFPRLSRFQATALIGTIAIAIVFVGRFALSFVDTILTFATLIVVCNVPWVIVMTIGFVVRRGWYSPDDLQVFNRGERGGVYWFSNGMNWRALVAWVGSAVVALLFVNLPGQFEGPLRNVVSDAGVGSLAGVDLSLAVALLLACSTYPLLLRLFPEPRDAFGPAGPRFVPATGSAAPPIEQVRSAPHPSEPSPDALDPFHHDHHRTEVH